MKFLVGFFSLNWLRVFDFLAPLAIRLLLAPIFWVEGVKRLGLFTAADFVWYNPMTWWNNETFVAGASTMNDTILSSLGTMGSGIIGGIEVVGAVLLVFGFAVRWIVLALLFAVAVLGLQAVGGLTAVAEVAKQFFLEHGYSGYNSIGATPFTVYITYFVLLLTLFFMGAGRWFSLDWYIYRNFARKAENAEAARHDPFEVDATDEPGLRTSRV